jgi:hypothetical protein
MTLAQANALILERVREQLSMWRLSENYPDDSCELDAVELRQLTEKDTENDESVALMHGECAERREE